MIPITKRSLCLCVLASFVMVPIVSAQSVTYQGELNQNGVPATGDFEMDFQLWDGPSILDGPAGDQITVPNVSVIDGRFTVELNFDIASLNNEDRWLRIWVEGTALLPFQKINRTPYAIQTRGIFVDAAERVGIGSANPVALLDVHSFTTNAGDNTARFRNTNIGNHASHIHWGQTGDWFIRSAASDGKVVLQDSGGSVGIGTSNPGAKLSISSTALDDEAILALSSSAEPTIAAINTGSGYALRADSPSDVTATGGGVVLVGSESDSHLALDGNEIMARDSNGASPLFLNREGGNVIIGSNAGGSSTLVTPIIQITGGSDLSEMFDVSGNTNVKPGMVLVIDPDQPGSLKLSTQANDRRVVGIVSGAGGVGTGMTMGHAGTIADGQHPVALSGRVYCLADATSVGIEPGDRLTTSNTAGHAMKVTDAEAADGAIIGKAMTSLGKGQTGLVLVLVNLQ